MNNSHQVYYRWFSSERANFVNSLPANSPGASAANASGDVIVVIVDVIGVIDLVLTQVVEQLVEAKKQKQ